MFKSLLDNNTLEKNNSKQNIQKKKVIINISEEDIKNIKEHSIEKNNINHSPFSLNSFLTDDLKNLNFNISTSTSLSKELNKEKTIEKNIKNEKKEKKNFNDLYSNLENNKLYNQYGNEILEYEKIMDKKYRIHSSFIKGKKVTTAIRHRMVDWMLDVFFCLNSEYFVFFRAVDLMDRYLEKSKKNLCDNDIHLIGLTCIYLSLKEEDIYPLRLCYIEEKIGHSKFTSKEILQVEKDILNDIDFEILNISTYDFILELFNHFIIENQIQILKLNLFKYIDSLKNISYFLCKLACMLYRFTSYLSSLKAVSIIICSFNILKSNSETFNEDMQNFIKEWILDLINESKFHWKKISKVNSYLSSAYDYIMTREKKKNSQVYKTHTFYFY